jgi:hypothetical protein
METIDSETGSFTARPWRLRAISLAAGLAAGLVSWLIGEAVYGLFAPPSELLNSANFARSTELARAQEASQIKNAVLAFGLLGAVLGMFLGAAGGVARRSARAAVMAALIGLAAGGAAGAGLALILVPIAARDLVMVSESLVFALVIHGGIWSAVGAAGGLAFGIGLGGGRAVLRAIVGGLVGALLGTIVYELLGAMASPMASTGAPLSTTWPTRLLARVSVTTLAALGAAWAVPAPGDRTVS